MCGIACIISSEAERLALVQGMVDAQRHRGPDHEATWHCPTGVAALGHARLSLVDLSTNGDQPMSDGRYTITYNGEIYNHLELRKSHLPRNTFSSGSDTATLLALIERYGVSLTLPLLRGMWAFAVWDSHEQTLTLATDPFGIKPLFVTSDTGEFACASTSSALLGLRPRWRVSPQGKAQFFNLGGSSGVWDGIDRVPGGTMLTYRAKEDSIDVQRWYFPRFNPNAEQELPALIEEALELVQRADLPVGLFLSGGVDSSNAASYCTGTAYHLASPEEEHARTVAEHYGLDLQVVHPGKDRVPSAHADIVATSGEPTMAGHIPWIVAQQAAERCKAAVSANGADELMFGYERTATDPSGTAAQTAHLLRNQAHYSMRALPKAVWPVYELADERFTFCAHSRWRELMLYVQYDLNPTLDAAAMCHGLEMRVPFLDHLLVEAALSLPHSYHGNKRVLRERLIAQGIPEETVQHTKLGFSMHNKEDLRPAMDAACRYMANHHGMTMHPVISGRDRSYLAACSMAWQRWELYWTGQDKLMT